MSETKMTPERLAEIRERWTVHGRYYLAQCEECGYTGTSEGFYSDGEDVRCPRCHKDKVIEVNPSDLPVVALIAAHDSLSDERDNLKALCINEGLRALGLQDEVTRLTAQLAEARAEAEGLREALAVLTERARGLAQDEGAKFPANTLYWVASEFTAVGDAALSTPPSHFAKRVELMGAVVEAAQDFLDEFEEGDLVGFDERQRLILAARLSSLEAHEKGGEG